VIAESTEYGATWLYLDEEAHHTGPRAKYDCRHTLLVRSDGTVVAATIDRRNINDSHRIGRFYGLGQRLRALVACSTHIILDVDDVVTSVEDY